VDALLYRACQEAVRNVEEHARAEAVGVTVRQMGASAVLEVVDDGRGIDADSRERASREGHVGLSILDDLVADAGGRLTVGAAEPGGTVVRVEVPAS
jgi:signal transduction histidine kinase